MPTLLQLKYFQALSRNQHLGRTAEQLYISQTTLSTMISKLEKELGVSLFTRAGGRIELNENGARYLQYVNSALLALSDGEAAMRAAGKNNKTNSMTLAISGSNAWGSNLIAFRQQHPLYSLSQQSETMPDMLNNLLSGALDMAIAGTEDLVSPELDSFPLVEGPLYAVFPAGHPLENRESIRLSELDGVPIIALFKELPFATFCEKMFRKAGLQQNIVIECDYSMRPRLLESGLGVVLLYAPTMRSPVVSSMFEPFRKAVITDEAARRTLALFWKKDRVFSPVMSEFRDFMAKQKTPGNIL